MHAIVVVVALFVAVAIWAVILGARRREEVRRGRIWAESWARQLRANSREDMEYLRRRQMEQERWEREQAEHKRHLDSLAG